MKEINFKIYNLNLKSFLFYLLYSVVFIAPIYTKKKEKEVQSEGSYKSYFDNDVDFYVPKYDFQRPYKFQKKGYQNLYRNLNINSDPQYLENMHDFFIFPESHLQDTDSIYKTEILDNIIKREVNIEDVRLNTDNEIYGYPDSKSFDESPKLIKDDDVVIKNYSEMGVSLTFTPNVLSINDKYIF